MAAMPGQNYTRPPCRRLVKWREVHGISSDVCLAHLVHSFGVGKERSRLGRLTGDKA